MKDITGLRFGKLTAIRATEDRKYKKIVWECKCDCGKIKYIPITSLQSGNTRSCGCYKKKNRIDLVGERFGKLKVIKFENQTGRRNIYWQCLCDCGQQYICSSRQLKRMKNPSCGCYLNKIRRDRRWRGYGDISATCFGVIRRRAIRDNIEFTISIEDLWQKFEEQNGKCALTDLPITLAIKGSVYKKCQHTASLDRIDSSKGYIKGNIQWVHKTIQQMKWAYKQDYFISMCSLVVDKHKKELK